MDEMSTNISTVISPVLENDNLISIEKHRYVLLNFALVTLNFSFTNIPTSFYEKSDQLIGFCVLELV